MKVFYTHIEDDTTENNNFRKVIYTTSRSQLVLMSLLPGEDIGEETHKKSDQFFRFEYGDGKALVDDEEIIFHAGDCLIIPSGTEHNIINTSKKEKLKLYTIYSPANHKKGIINISRPIK